jgi:hypothetical protein
MGLSPREDFVTRGLYATWRPHTVSGSAPTLGIGATNRADKLFECLSTARLVLRVFALPKESARNGPHESKQYPVSCLVGGLKPGPAAMGPRGVRRERPVDGKEARYITPLHTVAWGGAEDSSGTNVFSQALTEESGLCANPAFGMKLQFLTLVRD